jgi:Mg-chelatase subunit ChlI
VPSIWSARCTTAKRPSRPGCWRGASRFLYIDEVNLLEDHIVDSLLDVAASGENVVEREGLSVRHPARFVLVGSGNPEEGELRPQLLDRFGLSVEVKTPQDVPSRIEIVRQRDAFERDPDAFIKRQQRKESKVRRQLQKARESLDEVSVPDALLETAAAAVPGAGHGRPARRAHAGAHGAGAGRAARARRGHAGGPAQPWRRPCCATACAAIRWMSPARRCASTRRWRRCWIDHADSSTQAPAGLTRDSRPPAWQSTGMRSVGFACGRDPGRCATSGWSRPARCCPESTPWRKIPLHCSESRLLGGLDLAATLRAGRPVAERGLLQECDGGVALLAMAERAPSTVLAPLAACLTSPCCASSARVWRLSTTAELALVALDEGVEDEGVSPLLLERLALQVDLDAIPIAALDDFSWSKAQIRAARAALPAVTLGDAALESLCRATLALGIDSPRAALLAARVAR